MSSTPCPNMAGQFWGQFPLRIFKKCLPWWTGDWPTMENCHCCSDPLSSPWVAVRVAGWVPLTAVPAGKEEPVRSLSTLTELSMTHDASDMSSTSTHTRLSHVFSFLILSLFPSWNPVFLNIGFYKPRICYTFSTSILLLSSSLKTAQEWIIFRFRIFFFSHSAMQLDRLPCECQRVCSWHDYALSKRIFQMV